MQKPHAFLIAGILASSSIVLAGPSPKLTKRFVIDGPTLSQHPCDQDEKDCEVATYPAGDLIAKQRYMRSPSGRVTFRFHLVTENGGPTWAGTSEAPPGGIMQPHELFNYHVTVTATSPNGSKATKTVSAQLHGTTSQVLEVPIDVEWAESTIEFAISMDQEICPKRQFVVKLHEVMPLCKTAHTTTAGPDLSKIKLGQGVPQEFPKTAWVMLVTPAAAFQAPVVPVGIVYAPLGNAGKASYVITETTAHNQGFTDTSGNVVAYTNDDKTGWAMGITAGADSENVKVDASFKFSGSWDNSDEEDTGDTYGETGSVVTQRQIATTFSAPAGKTPLDQVGYTTQPFWQDQILASVNAQYALWDYPAGPVVQPLASASVVVLPILQLDGCAQDTKADKPKSLTPDHWKANTAYAKGTLMLSDNNEVILVATTAGTSGGKQPAWAATNGATSSDGTVVWTNEQDHVVAYAGSIKQGKTKYLWLTSADCKNLASLDKFYVAKSQSGHPKAYRVISGGSSVQTSAPTTYTNTDQTVKTIGTTSTETYTSKITAAAVTSQSDDFGISLLKVIGVDYGNSDSSQTTLVTTNTSANTLQKQKTVTGTGAASTTIQDSFSTSVPVNVVQDTVFEGMAVQDTNMHYKAPKTVTFDKVAPAAEDAKLPTVARGMSAETVARGERYLQRTSTGYVVVKTPTEAETKAVAAAIKAAHAEALKSHAKRPQP